MKIDYNIYEEDYQEEEFLEEWTISGTIDEVKAIAKSFHRACEKGRVDYIGFCERPKFNPNREYDVSICRDFNGCYTMYICRKEAV